VGSCGAIFPAAASRLLAPAPSLPANALAPALDGLADICGWLGTYRERMRMARVVEPDRLGFLLNRMEARYHLRWAELA